MITLVLIGVGWAVVYVLLRRWPARAADWLALGVLALACVAFFWRPLLSSGVWLPRGGGDYAAFYFPYAAYAAHELGQGRLPLWNPQIFGGMPLAADPQHGLFYPINLLFYLFNPILSYERLQLLTIGHFWLASLTAFALLRGLGSGRSGAMLGGIVYAYSGFMVAHFGHPPMLAVAAWIPLVLLAIVAIGRRPELRRKLGYAIAGGLALGIAFLAGHAQIWIYGLIACGMFVLALQRWELLAPAGQTRGQLLLSFSLPWLILLVVAAGIGAIQALPFLELAERSLRADLSYEQSLEFALHPVGLVQLLLPRVFGDSPASFWGPWAGSETQGYAGVITLFLAGIALLRGGRLSWALAALGGLGVLLALGPATPLHGWAYRLLPGLDQARAAGRALYLYDLAVALLAGLGLDSLLKSAYGSLKPLVSVVHTLVLALWAIGLPLLYIALLTSLDQPYLERIVAALADATLLSLLLSAAALLFWGLRSRRIRPRMAGTGLAILAVIDLFSAGINYNPTTEDPAQGYRHAWAFKVMTGSPGSFRMDVADSVEQSWQPHLALVDGPADAGGGWNPLLLADYHRLWSSLQAREQALYDLFAARYVVLPLENAPDPGKFTRVGDDGNSVGIFRNERALPRAYMVYQARVLPREALWEALQSSEFNPATEVLLEQGQPLQGSGSGTVTLSRTDPAWLQFVVQSDAPGYLVLSDADYPGWSASIDGRAAPILRANYALRALALPAGTHQVELRYVPGSLYLGAAISLITLCAGLAGLLWIYRITRR